MANTRAVMGEQACLDALVADTLTNLEDDSITQVGVCGLYWHKALTSLTLPSCRGIDTSGLGQCSNLEIVDMLGGDSITSSSCTSDTKLKSLILRGDTRGEVYDTAFDGTPILCREGAVYVPEDMVSYYNIHTRWKSYTIRSIEDYPSSELGSISDSWNDIITAVNNGTYASKYSVGDTKSIVIDGVTYCMQLVAKDADVLASDQTTTVATTWLMYKKLYNTRYRMRTPNSSSTGWQDSIMRSWLNDTVFPLLPSEVKSAVKEVCKYTGHVNSGLIAKDVITEDKLWIPSNYELNLGTTYETQGAAYSTDLYPSGTSTSAKQYRKKYNSSYEKTNWWLRSIANTASTVDIRQVSDSGNVGSLGSTNECGVCLGFCI